MSLTEKAQRFPSKRNLIFTLAKLLPPLKSKRATFVSPRQFCFQIFQACTHIFAFKVCPHFSNWLDICWSLQNLDQKHLKCMDIKCGVQVLQARFPVSAITLFHVLHPACVSTETSIPLCCSGFYSNLFIFPTTRGDLQHDNMIWLPCVEPAVASGERRAHQQWLDIQPMGDITAPSHC